MSISRVKKLISGAPTASEIKACIHDLANNYDIKWSLDDMEILSQLIERGEASEDTTQLLIKMVQNGASLLQISSAASVLIQRPECDAELVIDALGPELCQEGLFSFVSMLQQFHPCKAASRRLCERVLLRQIRPDALSHYLMMASEFSESDLADILTFLRVAFSVQLRAEPAEDSPAPPPSYNAVLIQSIKALHKRGTLKAFTAKTSGKLGTLWPFPSVSGLTNHSIPNPDHEETPLFAAECFFSFDLCCALALWELDIPVTRAQGLTILSQCLSNTYGFESVSESWYYLARSYSSETLVSFCWALMLGWHQSEISCGAQMLLALAANNESLASKSISHLVEAAFSPVKGYGEHRLFEAGNALLQLCETDLIKYAEFDGLMRWLNFWSSAEALPCEPPYNLDISKSSRILVIQVVCKVLLSLASTSQEHLEALLKHSEECLSSRIAYSQFSGLYLWLSLHSDNGDTIELPNISLSLDSHQLGALVAAVPHVRRLGLRQLLTSMNIDNSKLNTSSLEWPHVLITLARQLASRVAFVSVEDVDPLLLIASSIYALEPSTALDDMFDVLEDAETTMTKLQKAWLWTAASFALIGDCIAQPEMGGPLWSSFSRVLRRAWRAASSLPLEALQRGLIQNCLDGLYYCVNTAHVSAILQYCIASDMLEHQDSAEYTEAAYDRIFLAEWLLLHESQLLHWRFSFAQSQPRTRCSLLPIYCPYSAQPELARQLRIRTFATVGSVALSAAVAEQSALFPVCLASVSCFAAKYIQLKFASGQSQTAEQVRYCDSILSLVLGSLCILRTMIDGYKANGALDRLSEILKTSLLPEAAILPAAATKDVVPDLKLELFRVFWSFKDIMIRLPVLLMLKHSGFLSQSESGALSGFLLRNNSPISTKDCFTRVDNNIAHHFTVLCAGEIPTGNPAISAAILESIVISTAVECMKSELQPSIAFLVDFVSSIEALIASELADRVVTCKYRLFVSDLLPQYSFQLGSLCCALWQHPSIGDADSDSVSYLCNVTWRLLCLNLLALSDSLLDKTAAHDIRTLRTRFLGPSFDALIIIISLFRSKESIEQLMTMAALFNSLVREMTHNPSSNPDQTFRIQRKKSQHQGYSKLNTKLHNATRHLAKKEHGQLLNWASDVISKLVWQRQTVSEGDRPEAEKQQFADFKLPWLDRAYPSSLKWTNLIKKYVNLGLISARGDHVDAEANASEVEYSVEESADEDLSVSHEGLDFEDGEAGAVFSHDAFFVDGSTAEFAPQK